MANMSPVKNPMPEQDPQIRRYNFDEVALGYTEEMAVEEAKRCLNCKTKPCTTGCPVGVMIPEFMAKVAERDFEAAYNIIRQTNSLPAVCGRVCPQEKQCEGKCVRGVKGESVAIGRVERFVADYHLKNAKEAHKIQIEKIGKKVAVVGAGPAGLTCAGDLAMRGVDVTIYEAIHTPGGVLVYGIPEFRLPKSIVGAEIDSLKDMGVEIMTDMVIGRALSVEELFEMGYEAVFIGSGAGLPLFMGIPGEGNIGVYSANEFLTRINLMKAYLDEYDTPIRRANSVAVVGGGNVAMDAARSALRLGAENVYIVYRRSMDELPARGEEIHHAIQEGVEFKTLSAPAEILGDDDGVVCGLKCQRMELGEPDESGRCKPLPLDEYFTLDVDCVISAIGTSPNPLIKDTTLDIEANKRGCLVVNEELMTTKDMVWAGGDAVTGAATVILAMGAGKTAAKSIYEHLISKK